MITTRKPNYRGDHERTHFREFIKRSGSRSSRGSSRKSNRLQQSNKMANHASKSRYAPEDSSDDLNEPDTIAQGPINNTTAETAAQMASNQFFRPDYIVSYTPEKKRKNHPKMHRQQDAPPPQPQVTYQIVQPQVDWAAWRNELFALLQWERWQREEEEKRRKYQWMNEEEKYKNERESMERQYQRDLEERRRQFL
jgi:hypothetical protein